MKDKQQPMPGYEAPKVEVVEVKIEQGYAASVGMAGIGLSGWNDGEHLGDYDAIEY